MPQKVSFPFSKKLMGKKFAKKFFNLMQGSLESLKKQLSKIRSRKTCRPRVQNVKFTHYVIKVNATKSGWQKSVAKVLKAAEVRQYLMDGRGLVEVSGFIDPDTLLKTLGKLGHKVELMHWKFGECSSNLYGPALESFASRQPQLTD